MEVERAMADLAEVRDRLATIQRFPGYSGPAAVCSGAFAIIAGFVQQEAAPWPSTQTQLATYVVIWFICLGASLTINYGAIALWFLRANRHGREQSKTVGVTILPALVMGAVLSVALIDHGIYWMLPGVWCTSYAVGLFASRAMVPPGVMSIAAAFAVVGALLLLTNQPTTALAWWVMPCAFGLGQTAIGISIWQEQLREVSE